MTATERGFRARCRNIAVAFMGGVKNCNDAYGAILFFGPLVFQQAIESFGLGGRFFVGSAARLGAALKSGAKRLPNLTGGSKSLFGWELDGGQCRTPCPTIW